MSGQEEEAAAKRQAARAVGSEGRPQISVTDAFESTAVEQAGQEALLPGWSEQGLPACLCKEGIYMRQQRVSKRLLNPFLPKHREPQYRAVADSWLAGSGRGGGTSQWTFQSKRRGGENLLKETF